MTTAGAPENKPWSRRRLLALLVAIVIGVLVLLAGLGLAIYKAFAPDDSKSSAAASGSQTATSGDPQARRDAIARRPMLAVTPDDAREGTPAATPAATFTVPSATTTDALGISTGYPHTPAGAVAQLAAISTSVVQSMSIPQAAQVYQAWAQPGGVGASNWQMTANIQAFMSSAGLPGQEKDASVTVSATPVAAQVKGTDGPDWTLACVLLDVKATVNQDARIGYGYCEPMQWQTNRWVIAKGAPAAPAPSTWPGSEMAVKAGWKTWVDSTGAGE